MNAMFQIRHILYGMLVLGSMPVLAVNLSSSSVSTDDNTSTQSIALAEKPWAIYTQKVDLRALTAGAHTLNIQITDTENEQSPVMQLPLQVQPTPFYQVDGQANTVVVANLGRTSKSSLDSLNFTKHYGSSTDGKVWTYLHGVTSFDDTDIGDLQLTFKVLDAFNSENNQTMLPLVLSTDNLSGDGYIDFISGLVNNQEAVVNYEFHNGPISVVGFEQPDNLNLSNHVEVSTIDWIGESNSLNRSYFAFFDNDTDKIDDRFDPDLDNDGLTNDEEIALGTDVSNSDSDADGVSDSVEVTHKMDPLNPLDINFDFDEDGLSNLEEINLLTNLNNRDTDSDGIYDGYETENLLNPLENDAYEDFDGDNLSNFEEFQRGTSASLVDSDNDGINDDVELANNMDPLDDTDGLLDSDNDGLSDFNEQIAGTDPNNPDSDADGTKDGLEVKNGTDPLVNERIYDGDKDGLTDLIESEIGTDPMLADTDGDGISDGDEVNNGSDPLDKNSFVGAPMNLLNFSDTNNDGILDQLGYILEETLITAHHVHGVNLAILNSFEIAHPFIKAEVHILSDRNNDGIDEIGVFGFDAELNRFQLFVHDGISGKKIGVWNWPASLKDATFQAVSDLTLDGIQEYAITGIHTVNGTRQLIVKDGVSRGTYQTFKWPNIFDNTKVVMMSDFTGDDIPEVALYGKHQKLQKGQLFIYDGSNSGVKVDVYNWNPLWEHLQLIQMDDIDGEGTIDWGQFGQRLDDGRYQWVIKKGHDKKGVIRTFSWPNDLVQVKPMLVTDRTSDGVRDVAISGMSADTGKYFLRINDGKLANQRIANISWPANWEDVQIQELGDLNDDGVNEFGLIGYLKTNRRVQLVVKDGQTFKEHGRYSLSGNWEGLVMDSYDVDGDLVDDVVISGVNQNTGARAVHSLNGIDLSLLGSSEVIH